MASADFDPERMLRALSEGGVRYILIGGMAVVPHGDLGVTIDIDVVPERTDENLQRVIRSKEGAGREKDRLALPRLRRLLDRRRDGR